MNLYLNICGALVACIGLLGAFALLLWIGDNVFRSAMTRYDVWLEFLNYYAEKKQKQEAEKSQ